MANTTAKGYKNIHGSNPQALIEKVIRSRIYETQYWKEHCFALTGSSFARPVSPWSRDSSRTHILLTHLLIH